jgi:hypothetical protein
MPLGDKLYRRLDNWEKFYTSRIMRTTIRSGRLNYAITWKRKVLDSSPLADTDYIDDIIEMIRKGGFQKANHAAEIRRRLYYVELLENEPLIRLCVKICERWVKMETLLNSNIEEAIKMLREFEKAYRDYL